MGPVLNGNPHALNHTEPIWRCVAVIESLPVREQPYSYVGPDKIGGQLADMTDLGPDTYRAD